MRNVGSDYRGLFHVAGEEAAPTVTRPAACRAARSVLVTPPWTSWCYHATATQLMTNLTNIADDAIQGGAGSSEQSLIATRKAKASRMRERGQDPFTNDIDPSKITSIGYVREVCEPARLAEPVSEPFGENEEQLAESSSPFSHPPALKYDGQKLASCLQNMPWNEGVTVAGRVVAGRSFGKVQFVRVRDGFGEIQLFCRKNILGDAFDTLQDLDVADFVQATGTLMVTKTGELSIEARDLRILTKAYRPLPDKWSGMTDVELRYRRRYVDLIANAEARAVFRARSHVVRALRKFLDDRGFLEVETPTMNSLVGGATAKPFITHHNALDMQLFMRIAPELYLKRLVVGGFDRVYEIGRCYRNEGLSTRHNPEFSMLEFYMAYATYDTLMDWTEQMLRFVDDELKAAMSVEHQYWLERRPFRLDLPFERRPMRELIRTRIAEANEKLDATQSAWAEADKALDVLVGMGLRDDVLTDAQALSQVLARACEPASGLDRATMKLFQAADSHGERVFALYEIVVEPVLTRMFQRDGKSIPVFVIDHPVEVSPLARRQTRQGGDPSLVDRFELFVHGREMCNAFSELNDPDDQAQRFADQVQKKQRGADETMDYDEDYIRALQHGLPPTAGFGAGVDRLTMALTSQDSIREVILFPLLRPQRATEHQGEHQGQGKVPEKTREK